VRRAARFAPDFERDVSDRELKLGEQTHLDTRLIALPRSPDSTVRSFVEPWYAWAPAGD